MAAVIGCFMFTFIAWSISNFYLRFLDKTQYLKITQPINVDKMVYKPCDTMVLTTQMEALVDVNIKTLTQLILVKQGDGTEKTDTVIEGEIPIKAMGPHIVSGNLTLPCGLKEGRYFWQGNARYEVKGIEKTVSFITVNFDVKNSGELTNTQIIENKIFVPVKETIIVRSSPIPTPVPTQRAKGRK